MVSQLCTVRGGGLKLPSSRAGGAFGGAGWGIVVGSRGSCGGGAWVVELCSSYSSWGWGSQGTPGGVGPIALFGGPGGHPGANAGGCHLACTLRPTQAWKPMPGSAPHSTPSKHPLLGSLGKG